MEFFKTHFLTDHIRYILWGFAALLFAVLIFHAGVVVGSKQRMGPRGGEHGFRPPFSAPLGLMLPDGYLPRGHGAVGTITAVTLPTIIITEPSGDSETVYLSSTTMIDIQAHGTTSGALAPGQRVVIFGDPDESDERINAKVIHVGP